MVQNEQENQQHLLHLIDTHSLEDFLDLYGKSLSNLKVFEHVELLFRACRFGSLVFVKTILSSSSSIVSVSSCHPSTGFSLLFVTIRAQQHEITEYLIREMQADVNWSCKKTAVTCLQEAIRHRDIFTMTLLLQHGAFVDQRHLFASIIECFSLEKKVTFLRSTVHRISLRYLLVFVGDMPFAVVRYTCWASGRFA